MNFSEDDILYKIALTRVKYLGPVNAKKLVSYCGGVREVFDQSRNGFRDVEGINGARLKDEFHDGIFEEAEAELEFIKENNIRAFFFLDKSYPDRLKYCNDSPLMLYGKGNLKMNGGRFLGIVGTRRATRYGLKQCEEIIEGLADSGVTIVSGMAYGIDICAHKASVNHNLPTIGCLGHGLDMLYPALHRSTADKMLRDGGLITEFPKETKPDAVNFPKRNRIVAGMTDGILVVESGDKGGSLITADLAFSYSRDVLAVPGRIGDKYSAGCNKLIRQQKASLVQSAEDVKYTMGWEDKRSKSPSSQAKLFLDLSDDEEKIVKALRLGKSAIDILSLESGIPVSKASSLLLNLEFNGVVRSLPGKVYELC